jgi:hypothetical protein
MRDIGMRRPRVMMKMEQGQSTDLGRSGHHLPYYELNDGVHDHVDPDHDDVDE